MVVLAAAPRAESLSQCGAELEALCASDSATPEEFVRCARENDGLLTEACRSQLEAARRPGEERRARRREKLRTACEADVDRLCPGVPRRAKPVARCLDRNRDDVSSDCLRAASRLMARHAS